MSRNQDTSRVSEAPDEAGEEEAEHNRLFEILSAGMTAETAQPELLKRGIFGQEAL